jgi:hypothetical protein
VAPNLLAYLTRLSSGLPSSSSTPRKTTKTTPRPELQPEAPNEPLTEESPPIATPPSTMYAPSTSASPTSEANQMTQLMQAMLKLLQKNAAPAVVLQPQPPAPVFRPEELLRTFAGEPREDPEVFYFYFDKVGAVYLTPRHQILVAYRQLRGDAEKRNRYYKNIDQRVEELWDRLRRDYGADSQSQQLLATFMGATYKKTEPLEQFIDGQAQLYRRLFPRNTEKQLVTELILAVGKYSDLAHFTETASTVMSLAEPEKKRAPENWRRAVATSPTQPEAST